MRPPTARTFRISDALVLVAATALGLAGCRFCLFASEKGWGALWSGISQPTVRGIWIEAMRLMPVLSLPLSSWTIAVLLLRIQTPRPDREHLWRQPGFLACVAAVFACAWKLVGVGVVVAVELLWSGSTRLAAISYGSVVVRELTELLFAPRANVGGAVMLAWFVAWASGRCQPEPAWVDRAGRALGAAWICLTLLGGGVY